MKEIKLCSFSELKEKEPSGRQVNGLDLVLIRYNDTVSVLYGRCLRRGALVADGHVDGAVNIAWDKTDDLIAAIGDDKQRQVVFYCRSGGRAGKAKEALEEKGYEHIFNATGFSALRATEPIN